MACGFSLIPRAGGTLQLQEVDVELNEAFAAQAVYCIRALGLALDSVNSNAGAIALGHPLGAAGARMLGTILHALGRRRGRYGIVTMCVGGGMGAAALLEAAACCAAYCLF